MQSPGRCFSRCEKHFSFGVGTPPSRGQQCRRAHAAVLKANGDGQLVGVGQVNGLLAGMVQQRGLVAAGRFWTLEVLGGGACRRRRARVLSPFRRPASPRAGVARRPPNRGRAASPITSDAFRCSRGAAGSAKALSCATRGAALSRQTGTLLAAVTRSRAAASRTCRTRTARLG